MTPSTDEDLDTLLARGWAEHADQPNAVRKMLDEARHRLETSAQCTAWIGLMAHVLAEHLRDPDAALSALATVGTLPACRDDAHDTLRRTQAQLRYITLGEGALAALPDEDRIAVLARAPTVLLALGRTDEAVATYDHALARAADVPLEDQGVAARALAAGGNNLAAELQDKADLTPAQQDGMVRAAEAALHWWRRAGTWLHEERAQYLLAHCLMRAARPREAMEAAGAGLAVCARADAPAFERFFLAAAHAVAAGQAGDVAAHSASRAEAARWLSALTADERTHTVKECSDLGLT